LTTKELKARPDFLAECDKTGDGRIEAIELQTDLDQVGGEGVEVTLDGFLERWDLNHDGHVSREELPLWPRK
jgi:Ca2+-binding EF-hand superfamily protein